MDFPTALPTAASEACVLPRLPADGAGKQRKFTIIQVFCGRYGEPLSRSSGRACAARAAANRSAPACALFRSPGQCKAYVLCSHQTPSMRKGLSCSPVSRQNRELCSSLRSRWLGLRFAPVALVFTAATAPRRPSANSISRRALSATSAALRSSL